MDEPIKYVMVSGGRRYFRRRGCTVVRLYHEPGTPEFAAEYTAALSGKATRQSSHMERQMYAATTLDARLARLLAPGGNSLFSELERSAKGRAKQNRRPFALPPGWAKGQFIRQEGFCAVSGLPMRKDRKKRAPHAPSIDRIDSSLGYMPDNCRLVCYIVNCAMNMFTAAEFEDMCIAVCIRIAARRGKVLLVEREDAA